MKKQYLVQVGDVISSEKIPKLEGDRPNSLYVVESTELNGGGTGHGQYDEYPDGWFVTARRLDNGIYSISADQVQFYQTGSFTNLIENVEVVGKMKRVFVSEDDITRMLDNKMIKE